MPPRLSVPARCSTDCELRYARKINVMLSAARSTVQRGQVVKFGKRTEGEKQLTILDEMVLRQTLQAARACKTLCKEEADRDGELLPLSDRPSIHVLQQVRQRVLFKRSLEVLVSA